MQHKHPDNFTFSKGRGAHRLPLLLIPFMLVLASLLAIVTGRLPHARASEQLPPSEEASVTQPIRTVLRAYSSKRDLLILVTDERGEPIPDVVFPLSVEYPHGVGFGMDSETDGSLYLKGLQPGEYRLRMDGTKEYAAAEPISVTVVEPTVLYGQEQSDGWRSENGKQYYLGRAGRPLTSLHTIEGKAYYFNLYGEKASFLGIDVSFYNKGINWPLVRAQGVDFAIIRLAYRGWETGVLHEDSCFRQNLHGAKEAGLRIGVYIYSTAVNAEEAASEASMVLSQLNGMKLDLPVYLDMEQSGDYPQGRADKLSKVRRAEIVSAFCRRIEDGGCQAGVYSGQNFFKRHIHYGSLTEYATWLASYTTDNKLPDFPYPYDMWQFTDSGIVSGIRGIVDMNVVY